MHASEACWVEPDSGRVQAGRYHYRLTAWNSYGWSPPARVTNCTVPQGPCQDALPEQTQHQSAVHGILVSLLSVLAIGLGAAYLGSHLKVSILTVFTWLSLLSPCPAR